METFTVGAQDHESDYTQDEAIKAVKSDPELATCEIKHSPI